MTARILHYGQDSCHRLFVLRSAGYSVGQCGSVIQLRAALLSGPETDAVLITDCPSPAVPDAVQVTRSQSSARLVLFRDTNADTREEDFDLIIPALTPPAQWLDDIAILIEQSRSIRAKSSELVKKSRTLALEATAARMESRRERARSGRLRAQSAEQRAGQWGRRDGQEEGEKN